MEQEGLIFITGGARSGKSSFAEKYAQSLMDDENGVLHYVATAKVTDEEMNSRIKIHQQDRTKSKVNWKTWEVPVDIHQLAFKFTSKDIVLLDCLTILLTNELFSGEVDTKATESSAYYKDVYSKIINGLLLLSSKVQTLIVVSNEVLFNPLQRSSLVQNYAQLIGHLHQGLVNHATEAYLVEMGLPISMKN